MKHICNHCGHDDLKVIKTYPCEDHTLRHLKCKKCKTNVFTHEYVMRAEEYSWQNKRLILSEESFEKREELGWKVLRLLLTKNE